MMRPLAFVAGAALAFILTTDATAEERALLVGVGKYSVPGIDLPAIDLDLERMRETLILMGFEDSQIKSLLDEKATSKNVVREFKTWLRDGVEAEDRVVFYFSGHGSNTPDFNGDEEDGVDEVLVTHDVRRVRKNGRSALSGVVDDDTLAELLAAIPSNNIWFIVDACHSGTMTRDIVMDNLTLGKEPIYTKSFAYSGMPTGRSIASDTEFEKSTTDNYVSISAAADDEQAIGTTQGGVFTIGLSEAIRAAAESGTPIDINALRDAAAAYIEQKVDPWAVHHPLVTGNAQLASGALPIIQLENGNGPNRERLLALVDEQAARFEMTANQSRYAIDEPVELTMDIPMDGYLNVVTVDSRDNATVLFPNRYHDDHSVAKGTFAIPTAKMAFELPASEPLGTTLVVAFVSPQPINFYEASLDERNADGTLNVDFSRMSHVATRAIRVAPKAQPVQAAMLEIEVVR